MKEQWLDQVRHIHAQDAALFLLFLLGVLAVAGWVEYRKEIKEENKNVRKD